MQFQEWFLGSLLFIFHILFQSCVTALDQTWHPEHFVCASCGQPFGDTGFHERDGKPFCREDYYAMFAPRCGGCGQPIMDSYISALSAHWHSECFVCSVSSLQFLIPIIVIFLTDCWKFLCVLCNTKTMTYSWQVSLFSSLVCLSIYWYRKEKSNVYQCYFFPGMPSSFSRRKLLWAWWSTILWDALSRPPRYTVLQLSKAYHRPVHHCHAS